MKDILEGLEDYLSPEPKPAGPQEELEPPQAEAEPPAEAKVEKTDEELYAECETCHIAEAVSSFANICEEHPDEAGATCEIISGKLEDKTTQPLEWIKTMVEASEQAEGEARERMVAALSELSEYLEKRNSPFLKELEEG